jgi:HK97 family phage portal protein
MSSINPSAYCIDTFNESLKWNMNLLFNSAKPSAILSTKELQDTYTYEDNFKQLQANWKGSQNAGSVFLLNNTDYIQTSLSPQDMDYRESQLMAARYICQCFGVPPQLVGLPEAQTFNNVESAKVGLYEETILPLLDDILDSLNNWLQIYFPNEEVKLEYDIDKISALEIKRKIKMDTAKGYVDSGLISPNEGREMAGFGRYDPVKKDKDGKVIPSTPADNLYINSGKVPIDLLGDVDNYLDDEEFALTEEPTNEKE